ncbi:ABC transporter ATP-binding protein [Paenibacillus sp. MBLB4367]|uniref:ABC transporter ATP-binding protein n=1 Tax=Paenibacillus sp. MBLB4367 TaxID=3384767 RepID=UPI003907FA82
MSELRLRELRKQYGANVIVEKLDLTVRSGEMVSLLGPSGCGKTTTLRMVAGLLEPTSGSIHLADRELTRVAPYKRNVGLVFQNYALFPHLSIFENVAFGLHRQGIPKQEIKDRVLQALQSVQLAGMEQRMPAQLSGGQQQRVALARTLVLRPPLVLFDEPLSNLDAKLRQMLRVEIRQLQKQIGFTAIFVTHDQEEAMVLSDRIAVMNKGHIVQLDTPENVYGRPNDSFVADFVGDSNLLPVKELKAANGNTEVTLMGGRRIKAAGISDKTGNATAMTRPEAVRLFAVSDPAGAQIDRDEQNQIMGTVLYIHYTGSAYLIGLQVSGLEKPFLVKMPMHGEANMSLREGDLVHAVWQVRSTFLF